MKYVKKGISVLLVLLMFLLPIINAQTIVEVPQENEKKSIWSAPLDILKSPIFWGALVILAFITIIGVVLFFVVRWLIKFIKERSDAFWRLKSERLKLAKIHRRYNSTSWYKVHKNAPIRLVRMENGKPKITKPIAYHRGDYTTHEGNVIISMNLVGIKKWFILPKTDLLVIPDRESIQLVQKRTGNKSNREIIDLDNLPKPHEIIMFNENEILLFAESLSNTGHFFIPVIKSKTGKIIDLSLPTFESLKRVVLGDYLYEQTDEFSKLAKKSMDINPNVRAEIKTRDSSQNVEVPQGSQ